MYAPAIASGIPVARDPHRFINDLDNGDVERLVDRLESRARDEVFMRPFNAYAARLALFDAPMVLEVGCGTGAIARAIARRDGFEGSITGVDQSPALVDHATRPPAPPRRLRDAGQPVHGAWDHVRVGGRLRGKGIRLDDHR